METIGSGGEGKQTGSARDRQIDRQTERQRNRLLRNDDLKGEIGEGGTEPLRWRRMEYAVQRSEDGWESSVKANCKIGIRSEEHSLVEITKCLSSEVVKTAFLNLPKSAFVGRNSNKSQESLAVRAWMGRDGNHNCSPDPTLHFLLPVFKS